MLGFSTQPEKPEILIKDGVLSISIGNSHVLSYAMDIQHPPDSLPEYYQRSGFIHPLRSPAGLELTDDFPDGHTHQHGLFFALVNTTVRGQKVDFWNQQNGTGTVRHKELLESYQSDTNAGFVSSLEHLAIITGDTIIALEETWHVDVSNRDDIYVCDLTSTLRGIDTVIVNQYHYGGLGFRGSAAWNFEEYEEPGNVNYIGESDKAGFLTSSGKDRMNGNHSPERWVSLHGHVNDDSAGVVIMSHPDNFRSPQPVRLHPVMPYFSFSPMVEGAFTLLPGDSLVSKYRIITHDGYPDFKEIESIWESWIQ